METLDTVNARNGRWNASDSDICTTSVNPLQLYSIKTSGDKDILWQNTSPSSVRYCRPIRIQFKEERKLN